MSLSPQFLDELRARTLLSALIGRSVKLQKAGREWKACCPFHQEKTPSFYVNDEKSFYHCFGCQAHGDAIRFLTDSKGLPFMDAVKELADAAGMQVPAPDPRAQEQAERAIGLHEVMEAAQSWFEECLGGLEGSDARAYLDKRGVSEASRRRFGFGFAPDSRGKLRTALKRFGPEMLIEAGLLIVPEDDREPYDRFRGRLMFPIRDRRGRVIAFSARILGAGEPKYLNSPDTPLFDKGRTLFNIDLAAPAARESGEDHRRRGPDGRDRPGPGRAQGSGRAARDRAHRDPIGAVVADLARADPLLRRRLGRRQGRGSGGAARPPPRRRRPVARIRRLCPPGWIPTISSAQAGARRSTLCSTSPSLWSTGSGRTSSIPSRSPRPNSAPA